MVKLMMHRSLQDHFAAQRRSSVSESRSSFVAMVIAEWHKLVAEVSRPFARRRIHRAAVESQQIMARVAPLRESNNKLLD
jgi:hypothetical protein